MWQLTNCIKAFSSKIKRVNCTKFVLATKEFTSLALEKVLTNC